MFISSLPWYNMFTCFYLFGCIKRASRWWLKCMPTHTHTHRGNGTVFCETSLLFYFVLAGSKFFPGLYNFQDTYTIPVATPSAYAPHVVMPPALHVTPATHMVLPLRNTCVLFSLGNKWISAETLSCLS